MVRLISRQRGGLAALKWTKLFGINDFPAAKDSGKVLIIIIYCYLIIIIIIIIIIINIIIIIVVVVVVIQFLCHGNRARHIPTPLVFTTTGEMADECPRHHSRLAELFSAKE